MPTFNIENAFVLSVKPLGEKSVILSLLTKENGRFLGVFKGKNSPDIAQFFSGRWQARLIDQMGSFYMESMHQKNIIFMEDKKRLACVTSICYLLDKLLPERQAYPDLYDKTMTFLDAITDDDFVINYIKWEVYLLQSLGFGLDLSDCAGGGNALDLGYVSPNSGRAVSFEMGKDYKDKLLPLPAFLTQNTNQPEISADDIKNALNITGFFLVHHAKLAQLPLFRNGLYE